jgi:hypothetical protein
VLPSKTPNLRKSSQKIPLYAGKMFQRQGKRKATQIIAHEFHGYGLVQIIAFVMLDALGVRHLVISPKLRGDARLEEHWHTKPRIFLSTVPFGTYNSHKFH